MRSLKPAWQWAALAAVSLLLGALFRWAEMPASLLLGPMIAAVAFGLSDATIRVPRLAFVGSQAVIGLMVAHAVTASILVTVARNWPAMVLVVVVTVMASAAVGWLLTRYGALPGSTAAWGTAPGGAAAMVAMSEEHGADPRLVALMQYVRVVGISLTMSVVVRFWLGPGHAAPPVLATIDPGRMTQALSFSATLVIGAASLWLALRLRIPAGTMLVPMAIGAVLHSADLVALTLPGWFLTLAYAGIGWSVGLRFNREVTRASLRAMPQILVSTFLLIGLCAGSAWILTLMMHIDPLTAFLATSPGGLDSVAIIAVGSDADLPFVLALQTLRLFVVVMVGPMLARLISRSVPPAPS